MRLILACIVLAMPGVGAPMYTMTEIGTLGGTHSVGRAINSSGTVAGLGSLANGAMIVAAIPRCHECSAVFSRRLPLAR